MAIIRRESTGFPSLMEDFFNDFLTTRTQISTPAVNVRETDNEFHIEVAAPGMSKGDFNINVENNVLTISAEKEEKKESEEKYSRREFSYASFQRSFTLPNYVEAEKIGASYKDGVLDINIPKKDETKTKPSRRIEIK